jgi:hypothetical protein
MEKLKNLWRIFVFFLFRILRVKGYGISILVPLHLSEPTGHRADSWHWLNSYWRKALPGSEIILGEDIDAVQHRAPFSKSVAVNDAVSKAHGDIFAIVDADTCISAEAILLCAEEIRHASKNGWRLWFVPYRNLFRLTEEASRKIINTDPKQLILAHVPDENDYTNKDKYEGEPISAIGHWYGAMIQIIPRKGFEEVGGWDPRFRGWGGEDHAAMVAADTLFGPHKTLPGPVFHLWHPVFIPKVADDTKQKKRLWANQISGETNDSLSGRYYWSNGHPDRMRQLINEFKDNIPSPQRKHIPPATDVSS